MALPERNVGKKRITDLLSKQKRVIKKPYEDKIMKIAKEKRNKEITEMMRERLKKMKDAKIPEKKPRDPMLRNRLPMQTGPRKMSDRGPSRIMKPMPITPKDRDSMRKFKPMPIGEEERKKMRDRIMTPMKKGGAAKRGYGKAKR